MLKPNSTNNDVNKYKAFRNKYNRLKHHVMLTCYHAKSNAYKNDVKKLWQLINKVCGKTSNKTNIITNIKVNNIDYYSSNTICNLFGDYFANVGKNVAKKIPTPRQRIDKYNDKIIRNRNTSLYLFPTNSTETLRLIKHLPNKTSLGHDEINNLLLKKIVTSILKSLEIIFNHSITNHTFSNDMKLAEVILLFKGTETYLITNYRPVTLLITISKILEKIIYKLYNFLENNYILYKKQYGF